MTGLLLGGLFVIAATVAMAWYARSFAAALLFGVGFAAVAAAVGTAADRPSVAAEIARWEAAGHWPSVVGRLDELEIHQRPGGRGSPTWWAVARYHFAVNGIAYVGRNIALRVPVERRYPDMEARLHHLYAEGNVLTRISAPDGKAIAFDGVRTTIRFREQPVRVFHDPRFPDDSFLERNPADEPTYLARYGPPAVVFLLGAGLMGLGLRVARWRRRPTAPPSPSCIELPTGFRRTGGPEPFDEYADDTLRAGMDARIENGVGTVYVYGPEWISVMPDRARYVRVVAEYVWFVAARVSEVRLEQPAFHRFDEGELALMDARLAEMRFRRAAPTGGEAIWHRDALATRG